MDSKQLSLEYGSSPRTSLHLLVYQDIVGTDANLTAVQVFSVNDSPSSDLEVGALSVNSKHTPSMHKVKTYHRRRETCESGMDKTTAPLGKGNINDIYVVDFMRKADEKPTLFDPDRWEYI